VLEKEGYVVAFERRFSGFLGEARIDFKKSAWDEQGFVIETGQCC
jgi:hypothetical protein